MRHSLLLILISVLISCGTARKVHIGQQFDHWEQIELPSNPNHILYLVGDGGKLDTDSSNYVMQAVHSELSHIETPSTVLFLGDNIYPDGLPPAGHDLYEEKTRVINSQLAVINHTQHQSIFVPGNHDMHRSDDTDHGYTALMRQAESIAAYYEDDRAQLLPKDGCSGPDLVEINDQLALVVINTEWWLQRAAMSSIDNCKQWTQAAFIDSIQQLYDAHPDKNLILVGHHPMVSNGKHGGKYSIRQHLFPLTELNKYLYLPLPIIGSIFPLISSYNIQHINHAVNQSMMEPLQEVIASAQLPIYIAGHEHSLQYFNRQGLHLIISGSAAKSTYARKGKDTDMITSKRGFAKLYSYDNGSLYLVFYAVAKDAQLKRIFVHQLK